ncbi:4-Cys prefix domain-containing protein [Nostoc sp. UHCC 0302]|uniref:4-Cys prefix domain-containing protein n=1 Tax=Nostoc sp. UHCC 0302 TaxID=3134896 RepID=UPI00311CDCEF
MLYCSNSNCSNLFNLDDNKFCINCGQTLTPLFRNRFRVIRLLDEGGFSRTYEARDVDRIDEPFSLKKIQRVVIAISEMCLFINVPFY